MTLAEVIYEKSKDLPEIKAQEVIDFIDFFKTLTQQPELGYQETTESARRKALTQIAGTRIHWEGKPISSRDELYDDMRG